MNSVTKLYARKLDSTAVLLSSIILSVISRQTLLVCWTSLALKISQGTVLSSSVLTMQTKHFTSTSTSTSSSLSRRSIVEKAFVGQTLNSMTTLHVWSCSTRSRLDCFIFLMKNASQYSFCYLALHRVISTQSKS